MKKLAHVLIAILAVGCWADVDVASAEDLSAAKSCVVQTKTMQADFLALSAYLKNPDAQMAHSRDLLITARAALHRAEGACAAVPELTGDFLELESDLDAIEAGL